MSEVVWQSQITEDMVQDVSARSFLFEELDDAVMRICQEYGVKSL